MAVAILYQNIPEERMNKKVQNPDKGHLAAKRGCHTLGLLPILWHSQFLVSMTVFRGYRHRVKLTKLVERQGDNGCEWLVGVVVSGSGSRGALGPEQR